MNDLKKALCYIEKKKIDSQSNVHLTVDYLLEINNKITDLNDITLRKVNLRPQEFEKIYMNKDLKEDKFMKYQFNYQFSEMKIRPVKFYSVLLNKMIHFMIEMVERIKYCLLMIKIIKRIERTKNIKNLQITLN